MAQTKSKSTPKSKSKPKSRSKKASTSKTAKPAAKSKASTKAKAKTKSSAKPKASNGASRSNGSSSKHSNVDAVRNAVGDVGDRAKGAGKTVGKAASKAKVPLVAGGAAIAGAAGGMALAASKKGRKGGLGKALASGSKAIPRKPKIKVSSKDVAKAAKGIGDFSAQVSEIAAGVDSAASGRNGKHRSPVEVVLQGLTARR
jgi:hypothetical protein